MLQRALLLEKVLLALLLCNPTGESFQTFRNAMTTEMKCISKYREMNIGQQNTVTDGDTSDKTGLGNTEGKNSQCTRKFCDVARSAMCMCTCILIALGIRKTRGMAHSQVSEAVDGLQTWRGAANILHKELKRADRRRPSCFVVRGGPNNSSEQINPILWDDLSSGKCT
jgi:hypothetical protein